jgi:hypothetical protein
MEARWKRRSLTAFSTSTYVLYTTLYNAARHGGWAEERSRRLETGPGRARKSQEEPGRRKRVKDEAACHIYRIRLATKR